VLTRAGRSTGSTRTVSLVIVMIATRRLTTGGELLKEHVGAYDASFFNWLNQGSMRSAMVVLPLLAKWFSPGSVLDVGCGTGAWLSVWRELGVTDCLGIDGHVMIDALIISEDQFKRVNLDRPFALGRHFDLVMSLEVAEHLDASSADLFVSSIASHSDLILFSAAIPGQGGVGHINCQWPTYWSHRFATHGFEAFDPIRPTIWENEEVMPWYRQNTLLYARGDAAVRARQIAIEKPIINMIHPTAAVVRPPGIRESFQFLLKAAKRRINH